MSKSISLLVETISDAYAIVDAFVLRQNNTQKYVWVKAQNVPDHAKEMFPIGAWLVHATIEYTGE